jgi:hypothetical protein
MLDRSTFAGVQSLRLLLGLTLLSVLLVCAGRAVMPWDKLFPDYICYWTAGTILASGQSPYDVDLQTRTQKEYGWDRATTGFGKYDFLPFYYPPWFGFLWVLLVPLGFEAAKFTWFFSNVEMALVAGYLLGHAAAVPRLLAILFVPIFLFSFACILLGQTAIFMLFLIGLAWWLLEGHCDRSAGLVLAWLTIKPQLTAVLLVGILIWAIRQRRWRVVQGFLIALALLCLASSLIIPSWPIQLWNATRQTPSPTEYYPWIGNAWFLVLRALGLQRWGLWIVYLAVAVPFFAAVLKAALDRTCSLRNLLTVSILAAFIVAPYARHYDFTVLSVAVLVLLGNRLSRLSGSALYLALAILPYAQLLLLVYFKESYNPSGKFLLESTYFWIPVLLTVIWFVSGMSSKSPAPSGEPA